MAPVQLEGETRYGPVVAFASHILLAVSLMFEAGRSLHQAYRGLGPSQDTRRRVSRRNTLLPLFSGLALISLFRAVYGMGEYSILSYKVWASGQGVELPTQIIGNKGIIGGNQIPIHLVQWLSDTSVYFDAFEIMAEKTRRFWWGQQVELGLISWSMLLATEGRRRNIPLLWCYQLLGQLVSLAFAQNLFFVAMLLTPVPLPARENSSLPPTLNRLRNKVFPSKPNNWAPPGSVYFAILALNYAAVLLMSCQVNTEHFKYWVLASRVLTFAPLAVHYVFPAGWGRRYRDLEELYVTYKTAFNIMSLASFALHARVSLLGLAFSAPSAYYHRHSLHLPFDVEQRSAWERTTSAFGRILEATSDHPVVGTAGWEVLLAGVGLGLWVTTRATDVSDILASTVPRLLNRQSTEAELTPPPKIMMGRKAKELLVGSGLGTSAEVGGEETADTRRGSQNINFESEEDAYEPEPNEAVDATEEGDVLPQTDELDWEPAAVVWGLTALGGLGVGSAGAFGSETIGRL